MYLCKAFQRRSVLKQILEMSKLNFTPPHFAINNKILFFVAIFNFFVLGVSAQNTFPPTGNAIINNAGLDINNSSPESRILLREFVEPVMSSNPIYNRLASIVGGQQRGILIKDRPNMTGGLWLIGIDFGNSTAAGAIGAGMTGDIMTYIPLNTSASAITFTNGNIDFFANKGLTLGTNYWPASRMTLDGMTGNVGIGTNNPGSFKLAVEGKLGAREIRVTNAPWADFVFKSNYRLRPLAEVESFIKKNGHLPEVPSEIEITKEGNDLGKTDAVLLQKIEELTLYIIAQEKRMQALEQKLLEMQKKK